jgi:hypothetical protein
VPESGNRVSCGFPKNVDAIGFLGILSVGDVVFCEIYAGEGIDDQKILKSRDLN